MTKFFYIQVSPHKLCLIDFFFFFLQQIMEGKSNILKKYGKVKDVIQGTYFWQEKQIMEGKSNLVKNIMNNKRYNTSYMNPIYH